MGIMHKTTSSLLISLYLINKKKNMLKYTMKFRIFFSHRMFVPSETMKYLYLFTIFHMGNFLNNTVFF